MYTLIDKCIYFQTRVAEPLDEPRIELNTRPGHSNIRTTSASYSALKYARRRYLLYIQPRITWNHPSEEYFIERRNKFDFTGD